MKRLSVLLAMVLMASVAFSQARISTKTFTRPASNGTQYTAGDVVGTSDSTLRVFTEANYKGMVKSAYLALDSLNVANATFRLYLFSDTTGLTGTIRLADNQPFTLLSAFATKIVGYINFTLVTEGTGSTMSNAYVSLVDIPYVTEDGYLFGVLVATGAYTPKAGGSITVKLIYGE